MNAKVKLLFELLEHGAGFVVGDFVGVVGRAVAVGKLLSPRGAVLGDVLLATSQRELSQFKMGVGALEDIAAALGDEEGLIGELLGFFGLVGGGVEAGSQCLCVARGRAGLVAPLCV